MARLGASYRNQGTAEAALFSRSVCAKWQETLEANLQLADRRAVPGLRPSTSLAAPGLGLKVGGPVQHAMRERGVVHGCVVESRSTAADSMIGAEMKHSLLCPQCSAEILTNGPAVASRFVSQGSSEIASSRWVPFVEDLRGTPHRLVHAECFVDERDLSALIELITAHDLHMRAENFRLWKMTESALHQTKDAAV